MTELPNQEITEPLVQNHCCINTSIHLLDPKQKDPIFQMFTQARQRRGIHGLLLYEIEKMDNLGFTDLPLFLPLETIVF